MCHGRFVTVADLQTFSIAEQHALVLDGIARRSWHSIAPLAPIDPVAFRLQAIMPRDAERAVAVGITAVWVLGLTLTPPRTVEIAGIDGVRLYDTRREVRVREMAIPLGDCHRFGGYLVTTPNRTAADIARYGAEDTEAVLQQIAAHPDFDAEKVCDVFARTPHLPYVRRARRRLRSTLTHPVGVINAIDPSNTVQQPL